MLRLGISVKVFLVPGVAIHERLCIALGTKISVTPPSSAWAPCYIDKLHSISLSRQIRQLVDPAKTRSDNEHVILLQDSHGDEEVEKFG